MRDPNAPASFASVSNADWTSSVSSFRTASGSFETIQNVRSNSGEPTSTSCEPRACFARVAMFSRVIANENFSGG